LISRIFIMTLSDCNDPECLTKPAGLSLGRWLDDPASAVLVPTALAPARPV
jgi:hypothetical protein